MSTNESKPEWFQLAEADWAASPGAVNPKALKARRSNPIRIMAISTPLLVLGAGLLFAQTQQAPDAFASATTSASSAPLAGTANTSGNATSTPMSVDSSTPVQSSAAAAATPGDSGQALTASTPRISPNVSSSALSTLQSGLKLPAKGSIQSGDDGDGDDNGHEEED